MTTPNPRRNQECITARITELGKKQEWTTLEAAGTKEWILLTWMIGTDLDRVGTTYAAERNEVTRT
jgi:hypothetical protein